MAVRSFENYNYNYGSEAPDLWYDYDYERPVRRRNADEHRRNTSRRQVRKQKTAVNASPLISMFLVIAVMMAGLFYYISLQAAVTAGVQEIASMESELATLRANNDEQLKEIESSVSLDSVKYRAITELGMTYAEKDQIVTYTNDTDDYVHQVSEAGKNKK